MDFPFSLYLKKNYKPMIRTGFPGGSDGKESSRNVGDLGLTPGLGRSLGGGQEGMATHSRFFSWRTPLHRGAWQAIVVYMVAKSWIGLSY